jgi:hypothetical protein
LSENSGGLVETRFHSDSHHDRCAIHATISPGASPEVIVASAAQATTEPETTELEVATSTWSE